ncbi:hypothetical protein [Burkholderia ubonensis]|nr:hypothetical protein [Burkholderia ubonensis]
MFAMTPDVVRGQLMALAFVHPMFVFLAVGAILTTGWDRPVAHTPISRD